MDGEYLFVIPIYFKSLKQHVDAMALKKNKYVEENISMNYHLKKEEYEKIFDQSYFLPWQYSQIVGYIEINITHFGDLKAYYWFVKAKRLSANLKNRTMERGGKLFDVSKLNKSNEVIREDIRNFISILPTLRKKFKDRYFDTSTLEKMLDLVDFTKIKYKD